MRHMLKLLARPFLLALPLGLFFLNGALSAAPTPPSLGSSAAADSDMDAALFYDILRAEMLANQGQTAAGAALMYGLARKEYSRPELYQRAADLAVRARAPKLGKQIIDAWLRSFPQSVHAARYALQLHILAGEQMPAVQASQTFLRNAKGADRLAAIAIVPKYFAAGKALEAPTYAALEQTLLPYTQDSAYASAAWISLADLRLQRGDESGALDALLRVKDEPSQNEAVAWVLLDTLHPGRNAAKSTNSHAASAAQRTQARARLDTIMRTGQPNTSLRAAYTSLLIDTEDYAAAQKQLDVILQDRPNASRMWLIQGLVKMGLRDFAGAEQSLMHGLEMIQAGNDDEGGSLRNETYISLARLAEERGNYPQAEKWLDLVSDEAGNNISLQSRRALLLVKQGKWQQALEQIERLPESEVFDARTKVYIQTQVLSSAEQYQTAYDLLGAYAQKNPSDADAQYDLALLAEKLGKMAEMEMLLRQLIAQKPQDPQAYNALGYSLAERNERLPEAKQLIEQALQLAPGNAMITDSLGWVAYRMGNMPEARRLLQYAYDRLPDVEIAAHYGEVLWQLGERERALEVWRQAKTDKPSNAILLETVKRLKAPL